MVGRYPLNILWPLCLKDAKHGTKDVPIEMFPIDFQVEWSKIKVKLLQCSLCLNGVYSIDFEPFAWKLSNLGTVHVNAPREKMATIDFQVLGQMLRSFFWTLKKIVFSISLYPFAEKFQNFVQWMSLSNVHMFRSHDQRLGQTINCKP